MRILCLHLVKISLRKQSIFYISVFKWILYSTACNTSDSQIILLFRDRFTWVYIIFIFCSFLLYSTNLLLPNVWNDRWNRWRFVPKVSIIWWCLLDQFLYLHSFIESFGTCYNYSYWILSWFGKHSEKTLFSCRCSHITHMIATSGWSISYRLDYLILK